MKTVIPGGTPARLRSVDRGYGYPPASGAVVMESREANGFSQDCISSPGPSYSPARSRFYRWRLTIFSVMIFNFEFWTQPEIKTNFYNKASVTTTVLVRLLLFL